MTQIAMTSLLLAAASTSLLSVLKYVLLIVLWLFFLLVLRGVLTEVRRPIGSADPPQPREQPSAASRLSGSMRPPRSERAPVFIPPPSPARFEAPSALSPQAAPGSAPTRLPFDPHRFDPPSEDRASVAALTVREPAQSAGRRFPLAAEATLGRAPTSTVALPDDSFVSSTHARLWRQGNQVMVEDLGSTNGTFVNGDRISAPQSLHSGDRLQVGRTILEAST